VENHRRSWKTEEVASQGYLLYRSFIAAKMADREKEEEKAVKLGGGGILRSFLLFNFPGGPGFSFW